MPLGAAQNGLVTSLVEPLASTEPTTLVAAAILGSDPELSERVIAAIADENVAVTYLVGVAESLRELSQKTGATWTESVHEMISQIDPAVTHVWMLHDDARPRRGSLAALLSESLRTEASLAGSKVLIDGSELESVGGATDILLRPYNGLTPGEIDQGQYDVVRDVAFIPGASVLIRRDLLRGLDGPDPYLAPDSQAIDLAQRARIAGGRVVVVPSSEVFHDRICNDRVPPWREQAGEYRAALKVYSLVTLLWVIPFALMVSSANALGRLFMGEYRPTLNLVYSIAWNLKNLGTTLEGRAKTKRIRQVGDEELFRYQTGGSILLRALGADLTTWLRSRAAEGSAVNQWVTERRGFWQEVGFVAAIAAAITALIASRTIVTDAMPVTGYALPLGDAVSGLMAYAGGWNPSSLGTPASVHPTVGLVGAVQWLLGNRGPLTMAVLTIASVALAYNGMIRLLRRLGLGQAGRALGAWTTALGPVALRVADVGYWPATLAMGFAPWAIYLALEAFPTSRRKRIGRLGFGFLATGAMGMLVPLALAIPTLLAAAWALVGTRTAHQSRETVTVARAVFLGAVSVVFLLPWLVWHSWDDVIFDGVGLWLDVPWLMIVLFGSVLLITLLAGPERVLEVAGLGGLLTLAGVWLARSAVIDLGLEPTAAGLVMAGVGVGMVAGAAGELPGQLSGRREKLAAWVVASGAIALVAVPASVMISSGRLGFAPDQFGAPMDFTIARADEHGPDRVLFIGSDVPGGARILDGVMYRVGSAPVVPLTEAWVSDEREGDFELASVLSSLLSEDGLRPGAALAPFGIKWVVSSGPNALEAAFVARLDMAKLPIFDTPFTIYENLEAAPRSVGSGVWTYSPQGSGWYQGEGGTEVTIAENPGPGWGSSESDGFGVVVKPVDGVIRYEPDATRRALGWLALVTAVAALLGAGISLVRSK